MKNFNNDLNSAKPRQRRPQKKITPQRIRNIGLFYLQRFESSVENLRGVLKRRVDAYARENSEFNKNEAYQWIEDILTEFVNLHYLDDSRFAEMKIHDYLNAGKPARYIQNKLREKGISSNMTETILATQEYDQTKMALKLAKRKKIGPYRADEKLRKEFHQKDMGTLVRAGFDYDVVCEILEYDETQLPEF
ncbi:MAG: RecX family transcriptional regulator [Alphaproteobacteria bacterium]|nr:RecX family transcriptional regulator [Alphaproteobacteria bacterium]